MHKKSTFYLLICGTVIMIIIMQLTGKPLVTEATPAGILNLELANTKSKANLVINAWKNNSSATKSLVKSAQLNTYLDFIFIAFYALFLFTSCHRLAGYLATQKAIRKLLFIFGYFAVFAGVLDVLENIGMLVSLENSASDFVAMFTSVASIMKWILVIAILLLLITGLIIKLFEKRQASP